MNEIKIFPIFNQSAPGIWDDMLRVRIAAMRHNYNICLTDKELSNAMSEFQQSWQQLSHNFAFAAYDGDRMVGCLNGDVQQQAAYVRHLYVLPEYQGRQIGASLLRMAENTISLSAYKIGLIALAGAERFYRHMGYASPVGTNNYVKTLSAPKCRTVPVFYCAPSFVRACGKLPYGTGNISDWKRVNREHLPVYAECDVNSALRVVGVSAAPDIILRSTSKVLDDWACRNLRRVMTNYLSHQK